MNLKELKKIIPEIFEQVKSDVEKAISKHQSGYRLGLVSMGAGYKKFMGIILWDRIAGGIMTTFLINIDPLNSYLLEKKSDKIVWAYTYHILLHGYLASIVFYDGNSWFHIYDERECKKLTLEISKNIFKDTQHPAVILATKGINATYFAYPSSSSVLEKGWHIEWIENFEKSSFNYFM